MSFTMEIYELFLRRKRAEGLKIDPTTARVFSYNIVPGDPYFFFDDGEDYCGEAMFFAYDPERQEPVSFDDLPESTRVALLNKCGHEHDLTFSGDWTKLFS